MNDQNDPSCSRQGDGLQPMQLQAAGTSSHLPFDARCVMNMQRFSFKYLPLQCLRLLQRCASPQLNPLCSLGSMGYQLSPAAYDLHLLKVRARLLCILCLMHSISLKSQSQTGGISTQSLIVLLCGRPKPHASARGLLISELYGVAL